MRVITVILDSVGVGALPDAGSFGDEGANTLAHVAEAVGGLHLPNLGQLGLGNIRPVLGVAPVSEPAGLHGLMAERSPGKDTILGHWELMGVVAPRAFPTYPRGFPAEVVDAFTHQIGSPVLGNRTASGTEIIKELGEEHIRTGQPIVYTSADSVFQIAACEEVIPVPDLYRLCEVARQVLTGPHNVGRVIARPFVVQGDQYVRTDRRKDFSIPAPEPTVLDQAKAAGCQVIGIGKIGDIFAHRGLTDEVHTVDNSDGIDRTVHAIQQGQWDAGLVVTNLVDYDMKYGHRNDAVGYAQALEQFDERLPEILDALRPDDLLIITADHGCEPTAPGTDHTREYVPLLVYGQRLSSPCSLGTRDTFADVGATIAEALSLPPPRVGTSFLPKPSS